MIKLLKALDKLYYNALKGERVKGLKSKIHGMLDTADKNVLIGFNDVVQL